MYIRKINADNIIESHTGRLNKGNAINPEISKQIWLESILALITPQISFTIISHTTLILTKNTIESKKWRRIVGRRKTQRSNRTLLCKPTKCLWKRFSLETPPAETTLLLRLSRASESPPKCPSNGSLVPESPKTSPRTRGSCSRREFRFSRRRRRRVSRTRLRRRRPRSAWAWGSSWRRWSREGRGVWACVGIRRRGSRRPPSWRWRVGFTRGRLRLVCLLYRLLIIIIKIKITTWDSLRLRHRLGRLRRRQLMISIVSG